MHGSGVRHVPAVLRSEHFLSFIEVDYHGYIIDYHPAQFCVSPVQSFSVPSKMRISRAAACQ